MSVDVLLATIRSALPAVADPANAAPMQRYMKSALPFHGVSMPVLRRTVRPLIAAHPLPDRATWERAVRTLYAEASHREERYAALELAGHRLYRAHRDVDALPLFAWLVSEGAWWDLVDDVVKVQLIVRDHDRGGEDARMRAWARDGNMWVRRYAILHQLQAKTATDTALLADVVEANVADGEFFIRKAIGWALRDYAKTDPDWVRDFVAAHPDLSPLSRREATKHL